MVAAPNAAATEEGRAWSASSIGGCRSVVAQQPRCAAEEEIVTLSNDFIEVEFTTLGGAIRTVEFLQTKNGERDDYVFNADGRLPALSLSLAGRDGGMQEFALPYTIEQQTADSITFVFDSGNGLVLRRTYSLAQDEMRARPLHYSSQHDF